MRGDEDLRPALTRDCNSARAFDTLQRYRGGALAEFFRALRTLQALQAEAARSELRDAAPGHADAAAPGLPQHRNKPKGRGNPGDGATDVAQRGAEPEPAPASRPDAAEPVPLPLRSASRPNESGPGLAQGATAPGAVAPPRDLTVPWAQPSRSTP